MPYGPCLSNETTKDEEEIPFRTRQPCPSPLIASTTFFVCLVCVQWGAVHSESCDGTATPHTTKQEDAVLIVTLSTPIEVNSISQDINQG